jgi:type IV pilus assembly protein PilA
LRGFTMVELLAVVAMIGILAALALVGYRKYFGASRSAEAKATIAQIRIAQEAFRAETMSYLDVSSAIDNYYPSPSPPDGKARLFWDDGNADHDNWEMLNVVIDSPTRYGFATTAGQAGTAMTVPSTAQTPTWPNPPTEPWYVVQAAGDLDQDGTLSLFVASSLNGEIYAEKDDE